MVKTITSRKPIVPTDLDEVLQAGADLNDALRQSVTGLVTPWVSLLLRGPEKRPFDPGLSDCCKDPCHKLRPHPCDPCAPNPCDPCYCCIGDVDLVIRARPGETRVTPFIVHNTRKREKTVTATLSPWRSCDGPSVQITSYVVPPTFTIGPCKEMEVKVITQIPGEAGDQASAGGHQWCGCQVFYANLSFEGCLTRPIALALAVLAYECDPYHVCCDCGCC